MRWSRWTIFEAQGRSGGGDRMQAERDRRSRLREFGGSGDEAPAVAGEAGLVVVAAAPDRPVGGRLVAEPTRSRIGQGLRDGRAEPARGCWGRVCGGGGLRRAGRRGRADGMPAQIQVAGAALLSTCWPRPLHVGLHRRFGHSRGASRRGRLCGENSEQGNDEQQWAEHERMARCPGWSILEMAHPGADLRAALRFWSARRASARAQQRHHDLTLACSTPGR